MVAPVTGVDDHLARLGDDVVRPLERACHVTDHLAGGGDGHYRDHRAGLQHPPDGSGLIHRWVRVGVAVATEHTLDQAFGVCRSHQPDVDIDLLDVGRIGNIGLEHACVQVCVEQIVGDARSHGQPAVGHIAGSAGEADMKMIGEAEGQKTPGGQVPGLRGTQRQAVVDDCDIEAAAVEGNLDAHVARAGGGGLAHAALADQFFHHHLQTGGALGLEALAQCASTHGGSRRFQRCGVGQHDAQLGGRNDSGGGVHAGRSHPVTVGRPSGDRVSNMSFRAPAPIKAAIWASDAGCEGLHGGTEIRFVVIALSVGVLSVGVSRGISRAAVPGRGGPENCTT